MLKSKFWYSRGWKNGIEFPFFPFLFNLKYWRFNSFKLFFKKLDFLFFQLHFSSKLYPNPKKFRSFYLWRFSYLIKTGRSCRLNYGLNFQKLPDYWNFQLQNSFGEKIGLRIDPKLVLNPFFIESKPFSAILIHFGEKIC